MKPFALRARRPTPTAPSHCSPPTRTRAFLGGGTNLVDLMKLGVEHPDAAGRRHAAAARPRSSRLPDGGAAHRRRGPQQRPRRRPATSAALPGALAGAARRRLRAAAQHGHRRRQPAAAHPLLLLPGRHQPCNKREPGSGCAALEGVNRNHAILGASRRTASPPIPPTWPSRWPRSTPSCTCTGPTASARIPLADFHRLPGDDPAARHRPGARRADHRRRRCPPLPFAAQLAATARCATAPPSRSRWSRVAAALDVDGRRGARRAARARRRRRTSRGGRRRAEQALRGAAGHRGGASPPPPTPSSPRPARCATTPSRCRWRATSSSARCSTSRRAPDDHRRPRWSAPAIDRVDGPRKVTGTAPLRRRARPRRADRLRSPVVQSTIATGRISPVDAARGRGDARRARRPHARQRAAAGRTALASDLPVLQSHDVHYQGQVVAAVVAETSEIAQAAAEALVDRVRRGAARTSC